MTSLRLFLVLATLIAAMAAPAAEPIPGSVADPRLERVGPGDGLSIQVFGQPDMNSDVVVADDGTIQVPLVGAVSVTGLTPTEAGQKVANALQSGRILTKPQVSVTVTQSRSQRVTVLGEVGMPGRYAVDSRTSIFDLLAEAGGVKQSGAHTIYVLRMEPGGSMRSIPVDLDALLKDPQLQQPVRLHAGDSVHVPRADEFFVYGEVNAPNGYPMEPGVTVLEAITRAGGLTPRGSDRRIEIRRLGASGAYVTLPARLSDRVLANDVIRVKERIF